MKSQVVLLFAVSSLFSFSTAGGQIDKPADFYGFEVGTDGKLVGWSSIGDYLEKLGKASDRVRVEEIGKTTEGRPFLLAILSSATNLNNLAKFRNLQRQAAKPKALTDADARLLAAQTRLFVAVRLHTRSHEIAASQAAAEIAYRLAVSEERAIREIRDKAVILLIPSTNPDGVDKIVEWYNQNLNTVNEASALPFLSHRYGGDEYLEDGPALNLLESRLLTRSVLNTWQPHIIFEQFESVSQEARLTLELPDSLGQLPFSRISSLLSETLVRQGKSGLKLQMGSHAQTLGELWGQNADRVTSSVASAQFASPLFVPRGSLNKKEAGPQARLSQPWQGYWWHLKDVTNHQIDGLISFLEIAAREKEAIVYNYCRRNLSAIAEAAHRAPYAFLIPRNQHDPIAAYRLIELLVRNGVDVYQLAEPDASPAETIGLGDHIVPLNQALRHWLLAILAADSRGPQARGDGKVHPAHGLAEIMGVAIRDLPQPPERDLLPVHSVRYPEGRLLLKVNGSYAFHHTNSQSFHALNRLLSAGKKVFWLRQEKEIDGEVYAAGFCYIPANEINAQQMDALARELSLEVRQTRENMNGVPAFSLRQPRVGLFQPWALSADFGWSKLILESYEFNYRTLTPVNIREGGFSGDLDAMILPDMASDQIINGRRPKAPNMYSRRPPQAYELGIAETGVDHLRQFVQRGGTLIALGQSCEFAAEQMGLPVTSRLNAAEASAGGEPLSVSLEVDQDEPLSYGMAKRVTAVLTNGDGFRPIPWHRKTAVASFFRGSANAEGLVAAPPADRAAVLEIPYGRGRVVLIAIRAQFRAQTIATFKFLFNAILLSRAEEVVL